MAIVVFLSHCAVSHPNYHHHCYCSLQFYDGSTTSSPSLTEKLCGHRYGLSIVSTGHYLSMEVYTRGEFISGRRRFVVTWGGMPICFRFLTNHGHIRTNSIPYLNTYLEKMSTSLGTGFLNNLLQCQSFNLFEISLEFIPVDLIKIIQHWFK